MALAGTDHPFIAVRLPRLFLAALVSAAPLMSLHAQDASGIRMAPFHFDQLIKQDGFPPVALTLGFDHDIGEYLSAGLEVDVLWRNVINEAPHEPRNGQQLSYNGWDADYVEDKRAWGLLYRTAFFVDGNGDGGFYIGSYIGMRHITRTLQISGQYSSSSSSNDGPFAHNYTADQMVFPIGLRFGLRSSMDGWYGDIYAGIGYQICGGKNLFKKPEMADAPTTLAGLTWTLGYAYGFSW